MKHATFLTTAILAVGLGGQVFAGSPIIGGVANTDAGMITPVDNNVADAFLVSGYVSLDYFGGASDYFMFTDLSVAKQFSLGSLDLALGVNVDGYSVSSGGGIIGAAPFATLMTGFGNFSIGGIDHSVTDFMPNVRLGASRFVDVLIWGPAFKPYNQWIDMLTPVEENIIRYDGEFGDFFASLSYGWENQTASAVVSYDFGSATVYGGFDALADFTVMQYIAGVEAYIGPVGLMATMNTPLGGTDPIFASMGASYEVIDNLTLNASLTGVSSTYYWGAFVEYEVLPGLVAAAGYNDLGGSSELSASLTIEFGE